MIEKLIFKDVNFSIKDKLEIVLIKGLNQGIYGYHVYMKKGSQKSWNSQHLLGTWKCYC